MPHVSVHWKTNIKVLFCHQPPDDTLNTSGIYKMQCNTCNESYVGQTGRSLITRHRENIRYINIKNPLSAYAMHILNNRHEYGTPEHTLQLLHPCQKGKLMNYWEALYIQQLQQQQLLIEEQKPHDVNPLYSLANTPHHNNQTHHSSVDT